MRMYLFCYRTHNKAKYLGHLDIFQVQFITLYAPSFICQVSCV